MWILRKPLNLRSGLLGSPWTSEEAPGPPTTPWDFLGGPRTSQPQSFLGGPRVSVIDRPPPPAELADGGDNDKYELRFLSNLEREREVRPWLLLASPEERQEIESALAFRSQRRYAGRCFFCVGVFRNGQLQGVSTCEERSEIDDIMTFFLPRRVLRCFTILTKPKVKTIAGEVLVRGVIMMAKMNKCRPDFENLKDGPVQKYYKMGCLLARAD